MCQFYLQGPPSHKCFDLWNVECLLSLLESWALASSLTTLKLALKTATLLALITTKNFSDLTLLYIEPRKVEVICVILYFLFLYINFRQMRVMLLIYV